MSRKQTKGYYKLFQIEHIYFIIISVIIVFISYQLYNLQSRLSRYVAQVVYKQTELILNNISRRIEGESCNELDKYLHVILSTNVKRYFVLLYKNGSFYKLESEPNINVYKPIPFIPESDEKGIMLKVIDTDSPQIKYHNNLFSIGFSIYYPVNITYNGKMYKSIVILDYRLNGSKKLVSTIEYIRSVVISIDLISVSVLLIILTLSLKARYYRISSYTDTLTGLFNRAILKEISKNFNDRMVIAMIDIDFFKKINDTYGHKAGDIVLKELANIIRISIRKDDIVVRYGGEEFLVVLDCAFPINCVNTLERIRRKIETLEIPIEDKKLHVTISVGICFKAKNFEDCVKKADMALYKAKSMGRNRVEVYEDETNTKTVNAYSC